MAGFKNSIGKDINSSKELVIVQILLPNFKIYWFDLYQQIVENWYTILFHICKTQLHIFILSQAEDEN